MLVNGDKMIMHSGLPACNKNRGDTWGGEFPKGQEKTS